LLITSCVSSNNDETSKTDTLLVDTVWQQIKTTKKLVATTEYNSIDYFIYRGQPLGYSYELMKAFAQYIGVDLEVHLTDDIEKAQQELQQNKTQLLGLQLTVTQKRKQKMQFSLPIGETHQVLVQRKPEHWRRMTRKALNDSLIQKPLELAEKKVYVQSGTSFVPRLYHLIEEIGDTIYVEESKDDVETLIEEVSEGKIDYTIADANVAKVNETYYPNIDVHVPISFEQNLAWAVALGSDSLLLYLNKWLQSKQYKRYVASVARKYFKQLKSRAYHNSTYLSLNGNRISVYDKTIKQAAERIHWDWRLLASLIYEESRFNPEAESWAGAKGLMQLMPRTAKRFGISDSSSAKDQIFAGVKFIEWINNQIKTTVPDSTERLGFILAAYNCGLGHVLDAMSLAEKYGKDKTKWEAVSYYLYRKSNPKYYNDKVVKYGYCRGQDAVYYANNIMSRYEEYKKVIK